MEFFDLSTLVPLIAAVFIFMKLRSVLGTRTGHEGPPKHIPKPQQNKEDLAVDHDDYNDNVVAMPQKNPIETRDQEINKKIDDIASSRTKLNKGLKAIYAADNSFDPSQFMQGAKSAYEMVITSFAEGDLETLKTLLSKDVFDEFSTAIKERNARNETMISNFVGIIDEKFTSAHIENKEAQITVRFVTEMINAVADSNDEIIDGDPNQIVETADEWTFARSTDARDPNWRLIAT